MHYNYSKNIIKFLLRCRFWASKIRVWWVDRGWAPGVHQSCSITPPPQLDRGEKI